MLTPPALSDATLSAVLRESYGLRIRQVSFLPLGADAYAAVYRVDAEDGTPYFLKLKHENFAEVAVAVSAFLHAQGIRQVMAPLPTVTQRLWASRHGFEWILYPFFESHNAYETALSDAQWVTLGRSLKAIHGAVLPPTLDRLVPREDYAPRWRDIVEEYDRQVETRAYDDPIAESLAAFWITKRDEIRAMVARAAELAQALRQCEDPFVLCHTDLHAWNVLVGANGELAIVDWDETIFAPKERDLMFVGGGVGAVWDTAREEALFYQGYGATQINPLALSYYRYERIVADLAAYGAQIFEAQGSVEDRDDGLRKVKGQFLPNRLIAIAHRTYQQLPSSLAP
jgi:spectinomycin phosphotransferase